MEFLGLLKDTVQNFGAFIISLATLQNLLLMLGSMIVGITFGVLPGLSATVGIAMFTGLTYGLKLDSALIVLMGV